MRETDWTGWTAGAFDVASFDLDDGSEDRQAVAGWIKGCFALDYRPLHWDMWDKLPEDAVPWAWSITHLPTGWGVMAISGTASEVRAAVDELAAWTDWSAITPKSAAFFGRRVREWTDRQPQVIVATACTVAPFLERKAA